MSVMDAEYKALQDQGYLGPLPEKELQWLLDNGATSNVRPEAWRQMLDAQGFSSGIWNKDVYDWLGSLGYTGTLNERLLQFWEAGGVIGGDTAAWLAATFDPDGTDYELQAQVIGEGTPTFTNSELLLPDHEGVYKTIPANSATWHGARVVENHFPDTDVPDNTWGPVHTTKVGETVIDGVSCMELNFPAGQSSGRFTVNHPFGLNVIYPEVTQSWWLRAKSGTFNLQISNSNQAGPNTGTVTVTETWQRFSFTSAMANSIGVGLWNGEATQKEVYVAKSQIEVGGLPSEYISNASLSTNDPATKYYANENGNTVTSNVVTEGAGAALTEAPSLYAAPALTNLLIESRDMTDAFWGASGGSQLIPTYDQPGLTGEPNTASLLEDNDGAAVKVRTSIPTTITADTNTSTLQLVVAKDSDVSSFPAVAVFHTQGSNISAVSWNKNTGAAALASFDSQAGNFDVDDDGTNWIIYLEYTNDGTASVEVRFYPGCGLTLGALDASATGSIVVKNVAFFEGKTIAEVKGASPIVTAGSTVTTSLVTIQYDVANWSDTQGALYAEYTRDGAYAASRLPIIATRISGGQVDSFPLRTLDTREESFYSGGNSSTLAGGGIADCLGTFRKAGVAYELSSGSIRVSANDQQGSGQVNGAEDSSFGGTDSTGIFVLGSASTTLMNQPHLIRNIQRWDLAYADAKDKIDELMT